MKFASLLALALPLMAALGATSCIEDAVTTNPSDQPLFSTDTLALGELFTADPTPTHRFTVYNRHDRILTLSRVALSEGARGIFRLNVDGQAGAEVMGVDIRPNDSVLVFVEATLPPNAQQGLPRDVEGAVEFTVNGRQSRVVLTATGRDAATWRAVTLQQDTRLSPGQPYHIYDSLVVAPGATLTLEAGGELYFHSGASLVVRGRLLAQGTPQAPVVMAGDRFGQVATNIPYEIMSGQWGGVAFAPTSRGNRLEGTVIKNTEWGVLVQGDSANVSPDPVLTLVNCQLRNSKGHVLQAAGGAGIRAIGCELADASLGPVSLYGGSHVFNHCTIANYYLFTAITEPTRRS